MGPTQRRTLDYLMFMQSFWRLGILASLLMTGCAGLPSHTATLTSVPPKSTPTFIHTHIPTPTASPSVTPSVTQSATPSQIWEVCSPLMGVAINDLASRIVNPYHPPQDRSDLPHQGLDLADPGKGQMAIPGLTVQAVLPGIVAMVLDDRFPYGNAVLIETQLDDPNKVGLKALQMPTVMPTLPHIQALTCPQPKTLPDWSTEQRSVYVMYAHLRDAVLLTEGQEVSCGQDLGAIGDTGNALNPHLHIEMRIGPAGVRFGSLAHYDNSATPEEMYNYCVWRVSGWFQHFDPLILFNLP